jgi:hypothetical protein
MKPVVEVKAILMKELCHKWTRGECIIKEEEIKRQMTSVGVFCKMHKM